MVSRLQRVGFFESGGERGGEPSPRNKEISSLPLSLDTEAQFRIVIWLKANELVIYIYLSLFLEFNYNCLREW